MDHREVDDGSRESRGWGDQHDWVTLLDSMIEGSEWKPIMLVLHDDYCESDVHCREFRREFVQNQEIDNLSPYFHMVNLKNSEEHQARDYQNIIFIMGFRWYDSVRTGTGTVPGGSTIFILFLEIEMFI